jgi:plastocyanin
MKKVIGIVICLFMIFSAVSIQAEQNEIRKEILPPQLATSAVNVGIYDLAFHPDTIIIEPNMTVTWTNLEPQPHSVNSDDGYFRSGLLGEGESFSYTFEKRGYYPYHDGAHPATTAKVYVEIGGNQPPFKPIVEGTTDGSRRTTYNYTAVTFDPEGSKISYYFEWGDNTNSGWSPFVNSSTQINLSHSWNRAGNFVIKVQAKDFYSNATSAWTELPVSMPVSIVLPAYHFMEKLFALFPNLFPLLRHMMGY